MTTPEVVAGQLVVSRRSDELQPTGADTDHVDTTVFQVLTSDTPLRHTA
jgi:hypothetical protein